jgi:hypothetical protein
MQAIRAANEADLARLSLAGETLVMARQPRVMFGPANVPLPPGGFLQAVPEAEAAMVARRRRCEGLEEDRRPVLRLGHLHLPAGDRGSGAGRRRLGARASRP